VRTRKVQVGPVELSIAESDQGGRPLLLLHGFTGAKEDFTEWSDRFGEAGWHAVAPDHRGHGDSSKPESDAEYSLAIMAADALALSDALGWERFVLLGHSMGGYVAQVMAVTSPQRLQGLILMDTGHGPTKIDPGLVDAAIGIVRTKGMNALADMLFRMESPLDTPANRRVMAERPGYAEFGSRKLRATSPHLYASLASELQSVPDSLENLRTLPADLPTLVLVGDEDAAFLEASKEMAEAIPSARLALIPDAGHSPQFENPERWWEAVSGFLGDLT
jgi:pimeloyl-ACP methyl ester carboxylesterase